VCRYNWHSASSLGWPCPMLKYKYIFQKIKYTEAILSNSTRKSLWFEISKMLIAVSKIIVLSIITFGTLSFRIGTHMLRTRRPPADLVSLQPSTVVERRSLTGELSLSCAQPAADG